MDMEGIILPQSWTKNKCVVNYRQPCYYCKSPTRVDIWINCEHYEEFEKHFLSFLNFKPIDGKFNLWRFKRGKRMCYGCLCSMGSHKDIMNREWSTKRDPKKYFSLSEKDFREWFQSFFDFWTREDSEDYLTSSDKAYIPSFFNLGIY